MLALVAASLSILGPVSVSAAALAQSFVPPSTCPTCTSSFYVGSANDTLAKQPVVTGKAYDRFVQIWLENTNYAVAASNPKFQKIAAQGQTLSFYNGVTHPSEPNYVASIGGDFFGMGDDSNYYIPQNTSTIVDLLEAKNISWATYQENSPSIAYQADYAQTNFFNASLGKYTYYKRKHNPFIIFNSIANVTSRQERIRNFNNFAVDVNASALPQYVYITPNLVNDGHDTDITFLGNWVDYFLTPLLANPKFNDNRTLILLTFDENEDYTSQNTVFSVLLGGAVPKTAVGTTDPTYYTHYSTLSTNEYNWALGNLGRQDTNSTVNNVFSLFASTLNHTNNNYTLTNSTGVPFTNLTGIFPGPLNSAEWLPMTAPVSTPGFGGGNTFISPLVNNAITVSSLPAPQNLTLNNPYAVNPNITISAKGAFGSNSSAVGNSSAPAASSTKASGASEKFTRSFGAAALSVLAGGVALAL